MSDPKETSDKYKKAALLDAITRERPWNSYRYLLFYCPEYYPSGGMSDLACGFDDWSEVEAYKASNGWRHMMIADMQTNEFWPMSTRYQPEAEKAPS